MVRVVMIVISINIVLIVGGAIEMEVAMVFLVVGEFALDIISDN